MTIAKYLNQSVSMCPERDAIVFGDRRWTFKAYDETVNKLANAFAGAGAGKILRRKLKEIHAES